ncbi:uncharacterized protein LODBEIA_P55820 [Lodderomyces beijingensis]|uniref:Thiamine pyrophosphokinase n=1 Tax=Lodderomyces beijingensis TaxID=1775926 RepID=A0ABP0ZUN3_9ASCO
MSRKEKELKELVTEQPNSLTIGPPQDASSYHLIEPFSYLLSSHKQESQHAPATALLILNQEINVDLVRLWQLADVVVCADGAANRIYNYFATTSNQAEYIPNYIVGDFDSLKPEIGRYYESRGAKLIRQSSQYANDFNKAIFCIQLHFLYIKHNTQWPKEIDTDSGLSTTFQDKFQNQSSIPIKIYTLSAIGGRFDQTIQSINQLYILHQESPNLEVFYLTQNDILFLLYKGVNYVAYRGKTTFSKNGDTTPPTCGLLPLSSRAVVLSTHGLKYDVTQWTTQMTAYVSSSNRIVGENGFTVHCSDDILMNIEIDL